MSDDVMVAAPAVELFLGAAEAFLEAEKVKRG